jgi:hypothetical protein
VRAKRAHSDYARCKRYLGRVRLLGEDLDMAIWGVGRHRLSGGTMRHVRDVTYKWAVRRAGLVEQRNQGTTYQSRLAM